MADSDLYKKSIECPYCSSASQKDVLCVCSSKTRVPPVLVVEMSQTSSIGSAESLISLERKKEKSINRDITSGKDLVNIKDSTSKHKLISCSLMALLASSISHEFLLVNSLPSLLLNISFSQKRWVNLVTNLLYYVSNHCPN